MLTRKRLSAQITVTLLSFAKQKNVKQNGLLKQSYEIVVAESVQQIIADNFGI